MADSPYDPPEADADDEPTESPTSGLELWAGLNTALGIMGLLAGCMGCFGTISSLAMADAMSGTLSSAMTSDQAMAYADLMAASMRLLPLSALSVLGGLVTSALLTVGGLQILLKSSAGPRVLRMGVVVALIVDPIRVLLLLLTQLLVREENAAYMRASMGGPGMPPEIQDIMPIITAGILVVTILLSVGWLALKMLLYALTLRRLNKNRGY